MAMLVFANIFNGLAEETNSPAVIENLFAEPLPVVTNAPPKATFDVRTYRIEGNTVLPPQDFGVLSNYTSTNLDFPRLREGLGKVQLRYRELGFPTIGVTLPQQKLTNALVRVKVVEGKISDIAVTGNRYYSAENVRRALPSLTTNILLNTKWFQPELDRANLNLDRQIYPVVAPGLEPGTTELTLKVKDQFPLHGHIEVNDKSTPDTPLLRIDSAVQYDNLWQLNHQVGFDYNFSPQSMKSDTYSPDFYDQPMVASYSGYYRLPLGNGRGLRENYENLPVTFGYDEVTHKFNLPPATGNPELIFYASRSVSDTPVSFGPVSTISSPTNTFQLTQQSAERDLTFNGNIETKLTVPLREFAGIESSFMAGFDYKSFESRNFNTLFVYATTTNGTSLIPPFAITNNSQNKLYYLPISLGWVAARPDKSGSFSFNYNQSIFLTPLASARTNFQSVAGSSKAGGDYTTITAGLIRQQNLPKDWSAILNINGQWSSAPLIGNEQFGLGGTSGVRGYQNGENYGDAGWRTQFDLRAPPVSLGYFPTPDGDVPANQRCSVFMDYGEAYHLDSTMPAIQQWGTGAGFYLTAGSHFDARLTLGYALLGTPATSAGSAQAYFSVGFQF
jgi:hemolysin activation/secretion protein